MKQIIFFTTLLSLQLVSNAQFNQEPTDSSWKKIFRGSEEKTHDLIHTKLDVLFDFDKSYLYGKEWLTLKPSCYPSNQVVLDAKGMEIKTVAIQKGTSSKSIPYQYDGQKITASLDKIYTSQEKITLYFEYTSKPNELKTAGSAAITDAKGLYFINPTGSDKNKPTQIWTQGETESNSSWMITIDKPNQKSTEEISMTVPNKFVTLSNGLLISQKKNTDGSRTDYWKMDLPHAPYLFFMGVGDYAIIKDAYKGKEVSYYVEKKYDPFARQIFGATPEMMGFFSSKLGVEFPWQKYAQIVGRDYVSGAMENTTSTLHQESAYQNARELSDGNEWEETIAHELFHQWFGDLVTAESWSNITVNESFANYSEYLWDEYKHGKDFADAHGFEDMQGYLMSGSEKKDLVRYYYSDKEDVFDGVSYNKGGRILHMLRNLVGDEAFFKSLNIYLTNNRFKTGEAAQLRLAFEEATGKDLNWFWNQWYYGSGHPKLKINYQYDSAGNTRVFINQTQKSGKVFILPIAIDIYINGQKTRHQVTIQNLNDSFDFQTGQKPAWVSVDADKILLAEKTDNKSEENYTAQLLYGKNYLDRKEALDYFAKNNPAKVVAFLQDPFFKLKIAAIQKLGSSSIKFDTEVVSSIAKMATNDPNRKVKAAAIQFLVKNGDNKFQSIYEQAIDDSSYNVAGAAFKGLVSINPEGAYSLAKKYSTDAKGVLGDEVIKVLISKGSEADFDFICRSYQDAPMSQSKFDMSDKFAEFLGKLNDPEKIKRGVDIMLEVRNQIPAAYRTYTDAGFKKNFDKIIKAKGKEIEEYIKEVFK